MKQKFLLVVLFILSTFLTDINGGCIGYPCAGSGGYELEHSEVGEYFDDGGFRYYAVIDFQEKDDYEETGKLDAATAAYVSHAVYEATHEYVLKKEGKVNETDFGVLKFALGGIHIYVAHNAEELARMYRSSVEGIKKVGAFVVPRIDGQCWPIPMETNISTVFRLDSYTKSRNRAFTVLVHELLHVVANYIYYDSDSDHKNRNLWEKFGEDTIFNLAYQKVAE